MHDPPARLRAPLQPQQRPALDWNRHFQHCAGLIRDSARPFSPHDPYSHRGSTRSCPEFVGTSCDQTSATTMRFFIGLSCGTFSSARKVSTLSSTSSDNVGQTVIHAVSWQDNLSQENGSWHTFGTGATWTSMQMILNFNTGVVLPPASDCGWRIFLPVKMLGGSAPLGPPIMGLRPLLSDSPMIRGAKPSLGPEADDGGS